MNACAARVPFQAYLVGGAVRDALLGLPVRDHDYVVVGATPAQMLALGFSEVGRSFPVFLHPATREEYALARVESRQGDGWSIDASSSVALTTDLARRDLTINAMAQAPDGTIVDPYGGQRDLAARLLRHVGPAFEEDPLRILRVARFAAQLGDRGFEVDPETMRLMRRMVGRGDLASVPPERWWGELSKMASTPAPSRALRVLRECGALDVLLPELAALYGVPQNPTYHPEVDTGIHTEMVVDQAVRLAPGDASVLWASMTHDLGKALTPHDQWPAHVDHERVGLVPLAAANARWRVPAEAAALARAVCEHHLTCHRAMELRPGTVLHLFENLAAFRHPDRWRRFLLACEADKRGRSGLEDGPYPQADHLETLRQAAMAIKASDAPSSVPPGPLLGAWQRESRLKAIASLHGGARRNAHLGARSKP